MMEEPEPLLKLRPEAAAGGGRHCGTPDGQEPGRPLSNAGGVGASVGWVVAGASQGRAGHADALPTHMALATDTHGHRSGTIVRTGHAHASPRSRRVVRGGRDQSRPIPVCWSRCGSTPRRRCARQTHDTLTLSRAEDTEVTTEPGAVLASPEAARWEDSDNTQPEVAAPPVAPSSLDPAEVRQLEANVFPLWQRWTELIETIVVAAAPARQRRGLSRRPCRAAASVPFVRCVRCHTQRRAFYQELVSITQPWLNLKTFAHIEPQMLKSLLQSCKQIEVELNDGKVPWTLHQFVGLVLLIVTPVTVALWYWHSGRRWLASLVRSLRWDSSSVSLRTSGISWSRIRRC